ncbi:hypothetical protein TNCV_1654661 [Trichonephila clavipes]|nr:hypothetical protein TNCV_1654661 [Trichonephila clavipes]
MATFFDSTKWADGHGTTPLKLKEDMEGVSSELGNGGLKVALGGNVQNSIAFRDACTTLAWELNTGLTI